jgi:hypothetical protein
MSEFIQALAVSFSDLEYLGSHGYVEGVSKIVTDKLNELGTYKRPVQCTDMKRETVYIKDDNEWNKDDPEKPK